MAWNFAFQLMCNFWHNLFQQKSINFSNRDDFFANSSTRDYLRQRYDLGWNKVGTRLEQGWSNSIQLKMLGHIFGAFVQQKVSLQEQM